jgi:hypothetical protein
MTWVAGLTLAVVSLAVVRSLWSGLGPAWRWPGALSRAIIRGIRAALRRVRRRWSVRSVADMPDPFTILQMQHRLSLIASELRELEAEQADLIYYARAHRIHTRRSAYDQLLVEACKLAGVPTPRPKPGSGTEGNELSVYRSEDERFSAEIELAARGWHW